MKDQLPADKFLSTASGVHGMEPPNTYVARRGYYLAKYGRTGCAMRDKNATKSHYVHTCSPSYM
jgi:hypothetical protein